MDKVLVTGGFGLIGQELISQLSDLGFEINVLDIRDSILVSDNQNLKNKNINYFRGSILDQTAIRKSMRGCTYVFHLGAILGVNVASKNPSECLDVNVLGTRNILDNCVMMGVKKVVFSSSSEVYGEPEKVPIEETAQYQPKSECGVSKCVGEEYIKAYGSDYGLNYSIIRFFNVYGPMQSDQFVISKITKELFLGEPVLIYGDGAQVRAFCYVEDAVRGMIKAALNTNADREIFNIGNDKAMCSINDLVKKLFLLTGSSSEVKHISFKESDRKESREILTRVPNINKARKILGYEPTISLDEGLKRVVEYFKTKN